MMPSGPYKNTCSQALALESRGCTSSHHVQVLTADVVRLDSFGAARGIKHLMLTVPESTAAGWSSSLSVWNSCKPFGSMWLTCTSGKPLGHWI